MLWRFLGSIVFGFLLGRMPMYICNSQSILVSKFWDGGCSVFNSCVLAVWENWFHSHCNLSVVMVAR